MLIDRGDAGGEQTFAAAAATAADALASVLLPPPQGFLGGGAVRSGGGGGGRCCHCVGVIIANNRPGHEVFPMAAPPSASSDKEVRAPYPVVMVSQESGQLLKDSLVPTSSSPCVNSPAVAPTAPQSGACWGALVGVGQHNFSQVPDHLDGNDARSGNDIGGGVIVSLGAVEHCPTPASPAEASASASTAGSCSSASPATSTSSAVSFGEEDGDLEGSRFLQMVSAGGSYSGAGVVDHPFSHVSSGYESGNIGGAPLSCYSYSQSNAIAAAEELRSRAGNCVEVGTSSRGAGRGAVGKEAGEWKREKMLYRAKTLPIRFQRSIW